MLLVLEYGKSPQNLEWTKKGHISHIFAHQMFPTDRFTTDINIVETQQVPQQHRFLSRIENRQYMRARPAAREQTTDDALHMYRRRGRRWALARSRVGSCERVHARQVRLPLCSKRGEPGNVGVGREQGVSMGSGAVQRRFETVWVLFCSEVDRFGWVLAYL